MFGALKIVGVALALALDVFAMSVGVGIHGIPRGAKIRIGVAFAAAEIGMNLVGAGLGLIAGRLLGSVAGYIGFVALIGLGGYMIVESQREAAEREPLDLSRGWGLFLAALSISLDSLGTGFSILYIGVPLAVALGTIGTVAIGATMLGLTLGGRFGRRIEEHAELLGGIILLLTGVALTLFKALHIG